MVDRRAEQSEFCSEQYPQLVGALSLYTGSRDLAEEIAQEALVRAVQYWHRVSAMDAPGAWLYRVAINLASSSFTRRRLEHAARQRVQAERRDAADLAAVVDSVALRAALAEMPRRQRTALILRYYADLSVRQTAEAMNVQEGTVKALTHQGVATLRKALTDHDIEVPSHD